MSDEHNINNDSENGSGGVTSFLSRLFGVLFDRSRFLLVFMTSWILVLFVAAFSSAPGLMSVAIIYSGALWVVLFIEVRFEVLAGLNPYGDVLIMMAIMLLATILVFIFMLVTTGGEGAEQPTAIASQYTDEYHSNPRRGDER